MKQRSAIAMLAAALALGGAAPPPDPRALHERLLVLDTHIDTPANLGRPGWSILDRHDPEREGDQVDLPAMIAGGLDGGFFAIYTPQGPLDSAGQHAALDHALVRLVQIREMVALHRDRFRLVTTSAEARRAVADGRRFVFISMENSEPVAPDLHLIESFARLGVVMMGPVHFRNNALADSSTDPQGPRWHGLSPAGRTLVAEANRLGILLDASHASDETLRQMIALSKAPIICSHSGVRAIFDHPRNVSDDDLRALAARGGVLQINAFNGYMVADPKIPERDAALKALFARYANRDAMTMDQRRAMMAERHAIDQRWPVPRASFDDVMAHLLHAIAVAGVDHVGLSGDFDGGGGVDGFNSVADFPKITAALVKKGYSADDIAKIMGGNALRVLDQAQAMADPAARFIIPETR
jgi:membrane dipeptidase